MIAFYKLVNENANSMKALGLKPSHIKRMQKLDNPAKIAVVGKYVDLHDSYISVKEALRHAGLYHNREIEISWIHSENIERDGPEEYLNSVGGIVVPGGFGPRGVEGMIQAATAPLLFQTVRLRHPCNPA